MGDFNETEVESVMLLDGTIIQADDLRILRIIHIDDGKGSTGWYDRIHVDWDNGGTTIYPAHNVQGWKYYAGGVK